MKHKIKLNWGTGILITIIVFLSITLSLVFYMMSKDVDLVSDNYYEKEIKYQQQIDVEKRTRNLNKDVDIQYDGTVINFNFPEKDNAGNVKGELYFYRPSDYKKDFKIPIHLDEQGRQFFLTTKMDRGLWKLQVRWHLNNDNFYTEKAVLID